MKARTIRYNDDGSIELLEVAVPDPGPEEIQIRGAACGICAWDIETARRGKRMQPMAPPGHEGVGYVAKIGRDVKGFGEGDRVAGGGFATVFNIRAAKALKIPESPLADEHWIVEPVACVVVGLDCCRLKAGDRVAVIGAGFMGLMMLQVLLRSPLEYLVALDVNPARLDVARQLGVRATHHLTDEARETFVQSHASRKFDVVIDASGAQAGLDLAADIVRPGGLINLFGWIKQDQAVFDPARWHMGGFTVVNATPSAQHREPFPPAIRLLREGVVDLRPLVTQVVPLDDYPALMRRILAGDCGYIKGVVKL